MIGDTFAPTVKTVAGLLKGVCETLTSMPITTKLLTAGLTSMAVGFAFTKVGGLANVAKMIMGVSLSLKSTTGAVHALNFEAFTDWLKRKVSAKKMIASAFGVSLPKTDGNQAGESSAS